MSAIAGDGLRRAAGDRHLLRNFAAPGLPPDVPVFVRGHGCELWDDHGDRWLDGLSSLFCVNVGHGRAELADVAREQAAQLAYATTWDAAHPRAIELAQRLAVLAPDDLDHVFFTSGGSEAVDSALKLARAHHALRGEPGRTTVIARDLAYHGTTLGALSVTGLDSIRDPWAGLLTGAAHVRHTDTYRGDPDDPLGSADAIEQSILAQGPETVAAVILEPVQNSGGCLVPPDGYFARVREICDRYGVLLIIDDTICAFGRLGEWFGAAWTQVTPDLITTAKGLTSAYVPMGAVIASSAVVEPFRAGGEVFQHGLTFGGHPVAAAVALANLEIIEREHLLARVRQREPWLRSRLEQLAELPIVGDVRGAGFFFGIELVADQDTKRPLAPALAKAIVEDVLGPELKRRRLICRAADRGYPVVQIAPPLIAGEAELDELVSILRAVLEAATTFVARA